MPKKLKGPRKKPARSRGQPKAGARKKAIAGPEKRVAVIGIGNPLMKDDGAGLSVIDLLSGMPKGVLIVDAGTGGMGLLHILNDLDAAVIVDAVDFGGEPGEIRVLSHKEAVSTKKLPGLSLHEGDILKIIEMSRRLGECPEMILICAIQPAEIRAGIGLTENVEKAMPRLARAVKETVKKMR
ncbi:MAG: hydrogenase maturation protease [Euryarchaeota archaeon]|nr:hydrogenase maturation protease [Euryarchaeota archaeon]